MRHLQREASSKHSEHLSKFTYISSFMRLQFTTWLGLLLAVTHSASCRGDAHRRTIHICQRNNIQRTILVAVASGVDIVYQFLAPPRNDSAIIGIVSIDPPHHEAVPFLPCCIPILVLLSKSEDRLSLEDRQLFRMNANVILVYSKQKEVESIKWDCLEKAGRSLDDHCFWSDPVWLWIVRSIAKFAEAAARLVDDDDSASRRSEKHSEKEPPLTVELISKL